MDTEKLDENLVVFLIRIGHILWLLKYMTFPLLGWTVRKGGPVLVSESTLHTLSLEFQCAQRNTRVLHVSVLLYPNFSC